MKAYTHSTPSLIGFYSVARETVPMHRRVLPIATPLFQAIDNVMSLALCTECLKPLNTSDLPRRKPLVMAALFASLSARSFPSTPACQGQHTHRSLQRWVLNIVPCQFGLPIPPLFTPCSRPVEFVRMVTCQVRPYPSREFSGEHDYKLWVDASSFHCQAWTVHCYRAERLTCGQQDAKIQLQHNCTLLHCIESAAGLMACLGVAWGLSLTSRYLHPVNVVNIGRLYLHLQPHSCRTVR